MAKLVTAKKDFIIIFGSAPSTAEDIEIAVSMIPIQAGMRRCDYMAVGIDALKKFSGQIRYVATNHLEDVAGIRNALGEGNYEVISYYPGPGVDIDCCYPLLSGLSAITAAIAAIRLGYKRIILCGCPLTGKAPVEHVRSVRWDGLTQITKERRAM